MFSPALRRFIGRTCAAETGTSSSQLLHQHLNMCPILRHQHTLLEKLSSRFQISTSLPEPHRHWCAWPVRIARTPAEFALSS